MVGRKRRSGNREKNGRIQREKGTDPKLVAASQPHRKGIPEGVQHDPRGETNFGRLVLFRRITELHYDAGTQYANIVRRYRSIIEAPCPDPQSLSGIPVAGIGGERWLANEIAEAWEKEYNDAFEHLEAHAGNRGARAVNHWAVYDRNDMPIPYLICGLDVLIKYFGLTGRRKSFSQK